MMGTMPFRPMPVTVQASANWRTRTVPKHGSRLYATSSTGQGDKAPQSSTSKDILSGVVTALASVPTSIAFANIAGVNPMVGIWSSVVVGLIMSLAGATPGLIAGAAGVVAVPLAPLIATYSFCDILMLVRRSFVVVRVKSRCLNCVFSRHGPAYMTPTVVLAAVLTLLCVVTRLSRAVSLVTDTVMCVLHCVHAACFTTRGGVSPKADVDKTRSKRGNINTPVLNIDTPPLVHIRHCTQPLDPRAVNQSTNLARVGSSSMDGCLYLRQLLKRFLNP
jgi:hypothetical protein